ncbi:MAG: site-specific integrase [Gemmatimonas sp.]|nr:site-specific integrase [Gemmatimonas sp.]
MAGRGEITKRVTKAGEPRYVARAWADSHRSTSKTFTRKADAERWLTQRNEEIQRRGLTIASKEPLAAWLTDWLDVWMPDLRPHTRAHYRATLQRYVIDPHGWLDADGEPVPVAERPKNGRAVPDEVRELNLGARPLASLRPVDFQRLYNAIRHDGKGARSAQYLHAILHPALEKAIEERKLSENPLDRVKRPKATRTREVRILTADQARCFLEAIASHKHRALWTLELSQGVRPGEALALRWEDVDLDLKIARITKTLTPSRTRGDTKTKAGIRTLSLTTATVTALRAHLVASGPRARLPEALVFTSETGTPEHANNVSRRFKKLLRTLADVGIPQDMSMYELRHSCLSLLLANGMPITTVSKMAGHESAKTTLAFYAKSIPGDAVKLADMMDTLLAAPANTATTPTPQSAPATPAKVLSYRRLQSGG